MAELDAYHEAGHAFTAAYVGARVLAVTITPDRDDGPARTGDIRIEWDRYARPTADLCRSMVKVALAGPVAEMLYRDENLHPGFVPEWATDWQHAWEVAGQIIADEKQRLRFLEQTTTSLQTLMQREHVWAAVAEIADHLLAHDWLESEEVHTIVATWCKV